MWRGSRIPVLRRERDGPAATDVFVTAAFHASRHISGQGMDALEQAGDGRGWDEVLTALGEILSRKVSAGTLRGHQAMAAIEYLARHAEPGSDRAIRLVTLVRERWRALGIAVSVERRWPDMAPGGLQPEAVSLTRQPVRHHRPISDDTRLDGARLARSSDVRDRWIHIDMSSQMNLYGTSARADRVRHLDDRCLTSAFTG
jgi:hypothetical protein